jgi:hypothetical protein
LARSRVINGLGAAAPHHRAKAVSVQAKRAARVDFHAVSDVGSQGCENLVKENRRFRPGT